VRPISPSCDPRRALLQPDIQLDAALEPPWYGVPGGGGAGDEHIGESIIIEDDEWRESTLPDRSRSGSLRKPTRARKQR
jgi:hypothetical protein